MNASLRVGDPFAHASMSESSTSTLATFTPAVDRKVTFWAKTYSRLRGLWVSFAIENPLMWSWLRGQNPRSDLAGAPLSIPIAVYDKIVEHFRQGRTTSSVRRTAKSVVERW